MRICLLILIALLSVEKTFAICIAKEGVNLREGPESKAEVSWQVNMFMPFKKVTAKGNWVQLKDIDGKKHWVTKQMISATMKCTVVKEAVTPLMSQISPPKEAGAVDRYTPFKVIEKKSSWTKVSNSLGEKFWVKTAHLWFP